MGRELAALGLRVEVLPVDGVTDLRPYEAAVIGSAIRGGRLLPEAAQFVRGNRDALERMPVAFFAVGLSLLRGSREAAASLEPVCGLIKPVSVGLFAGALDPRDLSPFLRFAMKLIKAPVGDFRDWDAIRGWATQLGGCLKEGMCATGQQSERNEG